MAGSRQALALDYDGMGEAELVAHARARGVVRDDAEAEDVLQEACTRAFDNLDGFRGEASRTRQEFTVRCYVREAGGP